MGRPCLLCPQLSRSLTDTVALGWEEERQGMFLLNLVSLKKAGNERLFRDSGAEVANFYFHNKSLLLM